MFEDIINVDSVKQKKQFIPSDEICPVCKSFVIEFVSGVLDSAYTYTQIFKCIDCGTKWGVVYDSDLSLIRSFILK
jgi:transposase-like protein